MKSTITRLLTLCAIIGAVNLAQADLRDGLVSYWPLDVLTNDPSLGQNVTPDLGPNTNNLSDNSTMTGADIVAGVRGNAASFDGVGKYLSRTYPVGEGKGLPIYHARYYTISMWVRDRKYLTGTNQQTRAVFAEANNTGLNAPLFRFTTDFAPSGRTNLLAAAIRNNNNSYFFGRPDVSHTDNGKSTISTNMPFDGNWHHIAWVDNNGTARLYVDGELDPHIYRNTRISEPFDIVVANRTLTLNTFSLGAMAQAAVSGYFNGLIDDVAVWERALTQSEVNEMRTNSITLPITTAAPTIVNPPLGNTNLTIGQFYSLQALALGTHPRTGYQWYKDGIAMQDLVETNEIEVVTNAPIVGTTTNILTFTNLQAASSGDYTVVVSNNFGSVTSSVATLLISAVSPQVASLTNGQISYWPLDAIQGITTPDVVRGYDMLFGTGLGAGNLVPGKWGNAVRFNTNGILSRIHSSGDDLPISQYRNFTVSAWINAPTNSAGNANAGARYFAEGNSSSTQPWLSLGHVDGADQAPLTSARIFVRNDANQNSAAAGIGVSSNSVVFYDPGVTPGGAWHHIVYIQEEQGGAVPLLTGRLYVDGVRDTSFIPSPRLPRSLQNTTIGGALRTSISGAFGGGMIDDVAVWNRALTDEEIVMLSTNVTPAAPPVLTPLQITSFRADFPEVVSGDNAILRWAVSSTAAAIDINQGVGNVLSKSTNGFGNVTISNLTASTTFTITIQRGTNVVTAQTSVAVVNGVTAGWTILDDFQTYTPGSLLNPYWSDLSGGSSVENVGGNHMLNVPDGGGQAAVLPLSTLTVNQGQARTLFTRIYVQDDPATLTMLNEIGITDKSLRSPADLDGDVGPIARVYDDPAGDLAVGARNGVAVPANAITLIPRKLEQQQVYNLWIDVTNGPFVTSINGTNTGDTLSIWIQRLGENNRMLIASNYTTDRDLEPDFLTATGLHLNQLVIGNDGGSTGTIYVDDVYISKSGYNATVPVAWAGPNPVTPPTPTLTPDFSIPGQISLLWDAGALTTSYSLSGPWSVVPDSFGFNYTLFPDPTNSQQFLRLQR